MTSSPRRIESLWKEPEAETEKVHWPAVQLNDVFKIYRSGPVETVALRGLQLRVERGELVAVFGPSGCGKSTMLALLAALDEPSAGEVRVGERSLQGLDNDELAAYRARDVALVFQSDNLWPALSARENVALGLRIAGRENPADAAEDALATFGLAGRGSHRAGALSGGEQQRVAIAAAFARRASLVLADEPTGELDEASADGTRALIIELARINGTSVILVTHDPATAEVADRTLRIRDGRIVGERRGAEEALVIDGGWLRLPSDVLTQAGIGRRARVRPTPDGVIVTRADSDSGPVGPVGPVGPAAASARPQPPVPWVPAQVGLCSVARTYGYGLTTRDVLGGLTHDFVPGQLTAITGRSGAGKTTLLKLVAGLDRPSSGQVMLDGHSLGDCNGEQLASLRRERTGYLPQEPVPIGFLSAEENIVLALRIRGWDADAAAERAARTLTRAGLADRARQRVHRLSAGEAQRLALARALASARGLLIVDEPTSRQDESNARAVAALLAAAAHDDGQTVICATHDPTVIRQADKVVVLDG
jgi:ABC-type lipoprotein export system ATPase subunit